MQDSEVLELIFKTAELSTEDVEDIAALFLPDKPVSEETVASDFDGKAILKIINSLQNRVKLF